MGNDHDYVALEWVRGEMAETLDQARQALEAFAENRDDTAQIRFCLNYVHQVHGTLQMVEFYGAALLAEEMEKLAAALMEQRIERDGDAISVLMQAILKLPDYLEHLTAGRKDVPVVLLPILNDIRACRGESLLSDSSLFTPNLTPVRLIAPDSARHRLQEPKMAGHLKKLRKMYRAALLGIKKETNVDENFNYLHKVTQRLEKISQHTAHAGFWAAAAALIEMLSAHEIALTGAIETLIVDIEHELKMLYDDRQEALVKPVNEDVLKTILFYIAKSESSLAGPNAIKERFSLGQALSSEEEIEAERSRQMGPGKGAISSVTEIVADELAKVKDQLDLYVRSESCDVADLADVLPRLQQIRNTIAILGLISPSKVIDEQIDTIQRYLDAADAPDDSVIMDMAGALLYVEGSITGLTDDRKGLRDNSTSETVSAKDEDKPLIYPGQIEQANDALLREIRNGLEQAKNCIVNFSASNWDKAEIEDAPGILATVKGGLQIISLEKAAGLVDSCNRFVSKALLASEQPPNMTQLETLADAVTSIEYYLERLAAGSRDNNMILQVAVDSVNQLGFPVGAEDTYQPARVDEAEKESLVEAASAEKASDQELIDDEIIEVFIEETREVLEAVEQCYPAFRETPEDTHALTELRRSFHTLKGSGRLVGAATLGELAWAIENMLNRVIDQTIVPGTEMFALLDQVIDRLPDVIEAFKKQEPDPDISEYVAVAEALASAKRSQQQVQETESDLQAAQIIEQSEGMELPATERQETENDKQSLAEEEAAAEDDLIDDEIIEIFIEEAGEVLEVIATQLPVFLADYDNRDSLTELRRAFHTLKGSGRMVAATVVGELAWSIENLLNKVIDGAIFMNSDIAELIQKVVAILPDLVADFENRRKPSHDTSIYEKQAEALAQGESIALADADLTTTELPDTGVRTTSVTPDSAEAGGLLVDPVLLDIFASETLTHLATLNDFISDFNAAAEPIALTDDVVRALHTLKGSANTAGIEPIAKVVVPAEKFVKDVRAWNALADRSVIDILLALIELVERGLAQIATTPQLELAGTQDFLKDLAAVQLETLSAYSPNLDVVESSGPDPQLISIFLTEGIDILLDAEEILNRWKGDPVPGEALEKLVAELKTLAKGAEQAQLTDVAELCQALELAYAHAREASCAKDDQFLQTVIDGHESLLSLMDQVAAGLATQSDPDLLRRLAALAADNDVGADQAGESGAMIDSGADAGLDPELIEVFLEEALDTVENTRVLLEDWRNRPTELTFVKALQREFHTLKWGAGVAEVTAIADLADQLETVFDRLVRNRLDSSDELVDIVMRCHAALAAMVDSVANQREVKSADNSLTAGLHALLAREPAVAQEPGLAAESEGDAGSEFYDVSLDPELTEIFMEEAEEIMVNSAELLNNWASDISDTGFVKELQRQLHTLKGGARMAEIAPIGDLAYAMEMVFERIADGRMPATQSSVNLALRCHDKLASMVDSLAASATVKTAPELVAELQQALAGDQASDHLAADTAISPGETDLPEVDAVEPESGAAEVEPVDPELIEIFLEEAEELIDSTANSLQNWTDNFDDLTIAKSLQRDLHTLKGGARMANIKPIGDLSHELETLFESIVEGRLAPSEQIKDLMLECHDALANMVDAVVNDAMPKSANHLLEAIVNLTNENVTESVVSETIRLEDSARVDSIESLITNPDQENIIEIFLDEAEEQLAHVTDNIDIWQAQPDNPQTVIELQKALDALQGSARLADIEPVANLASAMANAIGQTLEDGLSVTEELLALTSRGATAIADMLSGLANSQPVPRATELVNQIATLSLAEERDVTAQSPAVSEETAEILEIFLEEASDLLETIDKLLDEWSRDRVNPAFNQKLQRALHTLKGGARLSGLKQLGDTSHSFESMLIKSAGDNLPFEGELKESTQKYFDQLNDLVDGVRKTYNQTIAVPGATADESDQAEIKSSGAGGQTLAGQPAASDARSKPPEAAAPAPRQPPQETIRVSAPLIDELVNLAAETSITRGRLETQISDFSYTLEEMNSTIERLKEQLRRMDIETEAQVLFGAEREGTRAGADYGDDFDPLEMDRYSSIQQLSRALTESASDLMDLKEELAEKSRDAETLLLQQSRINTELQEGLMKTRMIPFSSMVPRLRRIVRQVSGELKKKVEFDVHNAEGEMDRTVLERMVAPLEHMLRNALDHGIETRERRLAAGKPETGSIDLSLSREAGDIVLRMQDDGGGIPVEAIRRKAIERGLLDEKTRISDHEILQFIMKAGFSTAKKVTQISGRGVGMDVVSSEIKQLGGHIFIDSEVGKGTTFTVRLPFTVSVNRALMVNAGDDFYAIPLNTIEGIVRVSAYELEEYYKPDAPLYEYAGKKYKLQYIGSLLQSDHKPKLQGQPLPLPVILVRGGEQSVALQVDSLMSSREIVVKSLGVQFSSVRGVSGATILGDGSVVVILDLPALIRADLTAQRQAGVMPGLDEPTAAQLFKPTQVLVVDDSVTVRKVTSRLLQRNAMEVITAKDGVDAVAILQDIRPDIMLLDIEMPRMDGFEVASFVRHDESLQDVPIVMITSRTGQKHKDRAMSIGVNEYLGKPFQEKALLGTIDKLVKKSRR